MRGANEAGRGRRTRLTAERRRETILEAATAVFAASGYRAGKVSDVAARIGVTEPVIFQNFGSKAALFAAVLDRVAGEVGASLDDLAGYHESAGGLLARILGTGDGLSHEPSDGPHGPLGHAREPSHGPRAHHALFGDAAALIADPEAGEAAARVARVVAGHLADLVRRGQRDGSVRADVTRRRPPGCCCRCFLPGSCGPGAAPDLNRTWTAWPCAPSWRRAWRVRPVRRTRTASTAALVGDGARVACVPGR